MARSMVYVLFFPNSFSGIVAIAGKSSTKCPFGPRAERRERGVNGKSELFQNRVLVYEKFHVGFVNTLKICRRHKPTRVYPIGTVVFSPRHTMHPPFRRSRFHLRDNGARESWFSRTTTGRTGEGKKTTGLSPPPRILFAINVFPSRPRPCRGGLSRNNIDSLMGLSRENRPVDSG